MLINRLSTVAGVLVLALFSNNAVAQSDFYIFGAFGNTNSDVALGGLNRIDDDNSSYALGAGYVVTGNFSLEGAYQDFGSHHGETDCPPGFACLVIPLSAQADLTGISLSLIGSIPLTDSLDVYGKVGFVSWDVDFEGRRRRPLMPAQRPGYFLLDLPVMSLKNRKKSPSGGPM